MKFNIKPLVQQDASSIAAWQYKSPYTVYSLSEVDIPVLLDPANRYFAVQNESGRTIGYCCFGQEGRVPGGRYDDTESQVLDVGVGMHPALVGRGFGGDFVKSILRFAADEYQPVKFRVSIAEFNKRSQKTFMNLGFVNTFSFDRDGDGMRFVQLEREVGL